MPDDNEGRFKRFVNEVNNNERRREVNEFWQSLPGIITAIVILGGVVAAIIIRALG